MVSRNHSVDMPPASLVVAAVLALCCSSLGLVLMSGCKMEVQERLVKAELLVPDYLRVYSLRAEADAMHTVPMDGPSGKTWYRTSEPAFDLRDFDRKFTDAVGNPPAAPTVWGVGLWIADAEKDRLRSWLQTQVGHHIGYVLDGKLRAIVRWDSGDTVTLGVLIGSKAEAEEVAERIRHGGMEPLPGKAVSTGSEKDVKEGIARIRQHQHRVLCLMRIQDRIKKSLEDRRFSASVSCALEGITDNVFVLENNIPRAEPGSERIRVLVAMTFKPDSSLSEKQVIEMVQEVLSSVSLSVMELSVSDQKGQDWMVSGWATLAGDEGNPEGNELQGRAD